MKVLVTGASGLLGAHVMEAFTGPHQVTGVDRHPWWGDRAATMLRGDLMDDRFLAECLETVQPEVLVHCAAMVDVDACEETPAVAYACNGDLTRRLARAVSKDCVVMYITTDGIFRGDTPFVTEQELPCPRTVYGRSKLQGEWETELATRNHVIVRTNFYGWSGGLKQSSAEWLHRALETRQRITLFNDFFFTPIYVVDFAERLRMLAEGDTRGTVHLCGKDRVSKLEYGRLLAEVAGFSMHAVTSGSIDDARLRAPRPRDMSLDSSRFERAFGAAVPDCRAGLTRFVSHRNVPLSARFHR